MYRATVKVKGENKHTIRHFETSKEVFDDWREMIVPDCECSIEVIEMDTKKVILTFDNHKGDF